MDFKEIVHYIENTMRFGCRPGLARTANLLELLGNPHKRLKAIHVAGTNGKGSTTAIIANILKNAGYRTGMYISPHLYKITERITIDGMEISQDDFTSYALRVIDTIKYMKEKNMEEPTQFEMLTAMAFLYFEEKQVDFAVIEVGLGGAYDATNVIDAMLSIITSISFDHTDILGDTIEKIAAEKAGIIKENSTVVMYPQLYPTAEDVVQQVCRDKNARLVRVAEDTVVSKYFDINGQIFDYSGKENLEGLRLSLIGDHQLKNASVAVTAALELKSMGYDINDEHIRKGLETAKWPCRLSIVSREPIILIDGAHNEDGVNSLKSALDKYFADKKKIFVIGMLKDKNYQYAIEQLMPMADKVIASQPISERALSAEEMRDSIKRYCAEVEAEPVIEKAVDRAVAQCDEDSIVCICGSLYLAGSAYEYLSK